MCVWYSYRHYSVMLYRNTWAHSRPPLSRAVSQVNPVLTPYRIMPILNLSYFRLGLRNGVFLQLFPTKALYAFLTSFKYATCTAHLILSS
jgi:hypothetical protein